MTSFIFWSSILLFLLDKFTLYCLKKQDFFNKYYHNFFKIEISVRRNWMFYIYFERRNSVSLIRCWFAILVISVVFQCIVFCDGVCEVFEVWCEIEKLIISCKILNFLFNKGFKKWSSGSSLKMPFGYLIGNTSVDLISNPLNIWDVSTSSLVNSATRW